MLIFDSRIKPAQGWQRGYQAHLLLYKTWHIYKQMKSIKKEYTNGEVTIVWQNKLCIHSGICVRGLPAVFNTNESPWINVEGATKEEIISQVKKCPSGALSYYMNSEVTDSNPKK